MYARRVSLPAVPHLLAVLAVLLPLLVGVYATPARADVDIELIGETLSQEGYYVDSGSRYLRSDAALDRLRSQLESGTGQPVYVTVLPAGATGPGLAPQLARKVGRKGTYAVLVGSRLEAFSTALPSSAVAPLVRRATAAHRGNPEAAIVELARLLNQRTSGKKNTGKARDKAPKKQATPTPTETVETGVADQPPPPQEGPNLPLIGGLAGLAVALAGGFLLWRRRRAAARPSPAGYGLGSGYESGLGVTPGGAPEPGAASAARSTGLPPLPGEPGPGGTGPGGTGPGGSGPAGADRPPSPQPGPPPMPQSPPSPQPSPRHARPGDSGAAPGSFGSGAPGSFGGEPPGPRGGQPPTGY